jgi:transposase-like protein
MMKVREGGRVVNVAVMVATGVNGDGHREILGLQVASAEDGPGWLGPLSGVRTLRRADMPVPSQAQLCPPEG